MTEEQSDPQNETQKPVTQQDLDHVITIIEERLLALADNVHKSLIELLERQDKLEQITAGLIVGYAEQTVIIEALAANAASGQPERRREFLNNIKAGREEMLKIMKEHGGVVENGDTNLARAVEDLVDQKQSATPSE